MRKPTNAVALGFTIWIILCATIGLSEPYKVAKGDTLSSIAAAHGVSVSDLKKTNHIKNVNSLRIGLVIIIPEPPSTIGPSASPTVDPGDSPQPPHAAAGEAGRESSDVATFRTGLEHGWVVTENSGKIFVHERESGGTLIGLHYLIKETNNSDGTTSWTLHRPVSGSDGTHSYGRIVGVMEKPSNVDVTSCTCE